MDETGEVGTMQLPERLAWWFSAGWLLMRPTMLKARTEADWALAEAVFGAVRSRRDAKRRNDRELLAALHSFTSHNVTWRALPAAFGPWTTVRTRFWRLREAGVFAAFPNTPASLSQTAHLIQTFDAAVVRAPVSAAGAKGANTPRRSAAHGAASRPRSTPNPTIAAGRSPFP